MKLNLPEIVTLLEKEKCATHRYRALVYLEKDAIKINACCDNFKNRLEEKSKHFIKTESYQLSEIS